MKQIATIKNGYISEENAKDVYHLLWDKKSNSFIKAKVYVVNRALYYVDISNVRKVISQYNGEPPAIYNTKVHNLLNQIKNRYELKAVDRIKALQKVMQDHLLYHLIEETEKSSEGIKLLEFEVLEYAKSSNIEKLFICATTKGLDVIEVGNMTKRDWGIDTIDLRKVRKMDDVSAEYFIRKKLKRSKEYYAIAKDIY